jgi:hypothetical protein
VKLRLKCAVQRVRGARERRQVEQLCVAPVDQIFARSRLMRAGIASGIPLARLTLRG